MKKLRIAAELQLFDFRALRDGSEILKSAMALVNEFCMEKLAQLIRCMQKSLKLAFRSFYTAWIRMTYTIWMRLA